MMTDITRHLMARTLELMRDHPDPPDPYRRLQPDREFVAITQDVADVGDVARRGWVTLQRSLFEVVAPRLLAGV